MVRHACEDNGIAPNPLPRLCTLTYYSGFTQLKELRNGHQLEAHSTMHAGPTLLQDLQRLSIMQSS